MAGTDNDLAPSGGVGGTDAAASHNDAPGGEVGSLDIFHQVRQLRLGIVQHADAGVDDLGQVMGRDIGRHTYCNAGGAVYQQIGETAGQHPGLLPGLVKVGVPVHGVLFNVPQQLLGDLGHPRLGVTVGSGGVSINGAEVSVSVHQRIAHGKVLRQTDHCVIYGGISVGMIASQHVAHAGGGFLKGLVRGQVVLVHGVENAAVDRLHAVPHVRQGAPHNDAHGVLDVGLLHLRHQGRADDGLVRIPDLFGIILWFFTHRLSSLRNQ